MSDDLFYLEDSRSRVGNCLLWWAENRAGYTTDIKRAHVFTRKEAYGQHRMRAEDIPWPKDYIDSRVSHTVHFEKVDLKEASVG